MTGDLAVEVGVVLELLEVGAALVALGGVMACVTPSAAAVAPPGDLKEPLYVCADAD